MDAVRNAGNTEYDKPKQLCHLSYHSGTIHTVRFSPNGKWLASGADDKIICIYHLDPDPPAHGAGFGNIEPPPVENWKILKRLIGHDNDVQDLAWSYDSSILVSVGLDSKIVVWSGYTFEKLKTISLHQSHVKGIPFDPANKFFATASDDRTIKIFAFESPQPNSTTHDMVNNFTCVHTISNPFKGSPLTTYFRRCSWSPDGNHIAAANSVNGPVSSVAIINRATWDSDISLIGHEAPVEACAFAPRLFSASPWTQEETDRETGHYAKPLTSVIACAGQDKTLTVWNTSTSRPLVIAQGLAQKSISDLAWTPDGETLVATSLDGSVLIVAFEHGDLGYAATTEETEKTLSKYGASRKGLGVIEDVAGLRLEEISKAGEIRGAEGRMGALMGDAGEKAPNKDVISGKETPNATKESSTPAANGIDQLKEAAVKDKDVVMATDTEKEKSKEKDGEKEAAPKVPEKDTMEAKIEAMKSRVTITKEGRKRVAPMLVSSSGTGQSSLPQTQLMASAQNAAAAEAPQAILDLSKPYDGLPAGGLASMLLGNKRKAVELEEDEDDEDEHGHKRIPSSARVVPILRNGVDGLEPASALAKEQNLTPDFIRPAVVDPVMAVSQVRLGVPKVRSHIVRSLSRSQPTARPLTNGAAAEGAASTADDVIFEARNDLREPSRITTMKRGALLWQDFLPKPVMLVTGSKNFWAAACEDGTLYVWTPAGRRLLNALVLEAQPVIIESRGWWLLCITAIGMCHVWNIKTLSSPHPPVSLAPVLDIAIKSLNPHATAGAGVTSAHLNGEGHIVVTLSNGEGFTYSPAMYVWQRLSEQWWAVGSQYWNSNDSSISALQTTAVGPNAPASSKKDEAGANISAGIIPYLERHTTTEVMLKGRAWGLQRLIKSVLPKEGYERFESAVSVGHLENRVAAALALGARDEFRGYLFMYAKRLGAEGAKGKVEELLRGLLGGILKDKEVTGEEGKGWNSEDEMICGWDRKELLKGVVLILGMFFFFSEIVEISTNTSCRQI